MSPLQKFILDTGKEPRAVEMRQVEKAQLVVCVLASEETNFTNNVFDFCHRCNVEVQLRPHVPTGPQRTCYRCAAIIIAEQEAAGEKVQLQISKKTAAEIKEAKSRSRPS